MKGNKMLALDNYQELLRKLDRLKRRRDQAQGAFSQLMKKAKKELRCASVEDVEKLLDTLRRSENLIHKRYITVKGRFEKKHKKVLEKL